MVRDGMGGKELSKEVVTGRNELGEFSVGVRIDECFISGQKGSTYNGIIFPAVDYLEG